MRTDRSRRRGMPLAIVSIMAMVAAFGVGSPAVAVSHPMDGRHDGHGGHFGHRDHRDRHHHKIHHGHDHRHHRHGNVRIDVEMSLNGGRDDAQGRFWADGAIDDSGAASFRYHSDGRHRDHHGHPHPHGHKWKRGNHVHCEQHLHSDEGKLLLSWVGHRHWHRGTLFVFGHWWVGESGGAYADLDGHGHVWYEIDFERHRVDGHFEGHLD